MERTERIEWTLGNGRQATITLTLFAGERTRTAYADGANVETSKHVTEITTRCEVEGMGEIQGWISEAVTDAMRQAAPDAAGRFGPVVIREAQMEEIRAARGRLEATPEWQAHEERERAQAAESAEYEEHRARMARVMGTEG